MKKYVIIFLLFFSFGFAQDLSFKDKLYKAKKGDFIVFELNKFYSALCVFDIENTDIILEEITISKDKFDKNNISFRSWIENGAKKNNSWTIYKIDLETNKIKDAFSICKNSWIKLTTNESLITGLLNINLTKITDNQRKKNGSTTQINTKKLWNPIKIVDSKKIINPTFDVYKSIWPDDGSEFSNKVFEIYFSQDFSFPYFLEIQNGNLSHFIKAIDSGNNLKSTVQYFPRKKPELEEVKLNQTNLFIKLSNATYFKDFNLFAIDFTRKEKIIHTLSFEMKKEKDFIFLEISLENLNKIFEKNHKYKIVVTPKFYKDIYIESKEFLIWK